MDVASRTSVDLIYFIVLCIYITNFLISSAFRHRTTAMIFFTDSFGLYLLTKTESGDKFFNNLCGHFVVVVVEKYLWE